MPARSPAKSLIARRLPTLTLLLCGIASPVFGQRPPDDSVLGTAIAAAEAGRFDAAQYPGIAAHPAYGWVEYAALRRNMDLMLPAQAQAFLGRYRGQPVAEAFRADWLASRSRVKDWAGFRAEW